MAGSTVHVQENHAGGLGIEVRILGGQRIDELFLPVGGHGLARKKIGIEQTREGQPGEAGTGLPEKLSPRSTTEVRMCLCHGIGCYVDETGSAVRVLAGFSRDK